MGFFGSIKGKKSNKKSYSCYDEGIGEYGYDEYHPQHESSSRKNDAGPTTNKRPSRWGAITKQKGVKYSRNSSLTLGTARTTTTTGTSSLSQPINSVIYQNNIDNNNDGMGKFESHLDDDDYFDVEKLKSHFGNGSDEDSNSNNAEEEEEDNNDSEEEDLGQELDRATVRLDGIEVYAIVSALTCATSISCFDNFDPTPLDVVINEYAVFTFIADMCYYVSGALGMMTGLHATLIFSLVTMYGRTALGIDRDDAFNIFFGNTGAARFSGFKSFKLSLYCFMTQLTFLIEKKFVFTPLRPIVLLGTGYLAYNHMYKDSESVLAAAGVIYSTPPTPVVPKKVARVSVATFGSAAGGPPKRRSSVKSNRFSLSTRNFGVDTSVKANEDADLLATTPTSTYDNNNDMDED